MKNLHLIFVIVLIAKLSTAGIIVSNLEEEDYRETTTHNKELHQVDNGIVGELNETFTTEAYVSETHGFEDEDSETLGSSRQGRFLLSHMSSQIVGLMRMSPSPYYVPSRPGDVFDFLRDNYPLPLGIYEPQKSYDFVVIGAGSAGSVIASRLSEGGRFTVLLLEAGGPESLLTEVPLLAAYFQHTDYNWGYRMEKQKGVCMGMEEQRCNWPKGKAIGGSSVINYMIYTRGNKIDWDRVAAAGNPGWSYDEVLPYFLKSERANLRGLESSPYHSKEGLMSIEFAPYKTRVLDAFLKAAVELDNKLVDYNQGDQYGFSRIQCHTLNGWRHSAAKAFLHPFKNRRNLHILPFSRVTKINIKKSTKTATSVEYVRNRVRHKVRARKEIVLSAGSLSSPQLLMLSGVGPKKDLKKLGIPVIKDLRVGKTMYDHVCFPGLLFLVNCTDCTTTETGVLTPENIAEWLKFGRGPLTMVGGVEGIGYIKTKISEEAGEYPDMEFVFVSGGLSSDATGAIRKGMKISDEFYEEVFQEINEKPNWGIMPMLIHPKSKGHLELKDKNPFHWPRFYYDYFSDKRDLYTLIEAIKYAIKISKTKAFQKLGSRLYDKPYPNCKHLTFGSDTYWECAIRTLGTTLHHQIATCKMGPASDPEAVVDNELRVHGIKRLRVGDASIIPRPLTAHTQAPTIMVGEKLADILLKAWE